MNKTKKSLLMIIGIICILISIFIPLQVQAATKETPEPNTESSNKVLNSIKQNGAKSEGKTVYFNYEMLQSRNDTYCVQKGASLTNNWTLYKVEKYVKIVGKQATDSTGKTKNSQANARLAYIISKQQGYNNCSPGQMAMWNQINSWYTNVGSVLGIDNKCENNNVAENDIVKEAREYANSIGTNAEQKITNNTDKTKITVKQQVTNNTSYIRVGPFNYTFDGKITSLSVKGDNNQNVSEVQYSVYEGQNEQYINVNQIKSGKDFYITIKADSGISKITKLEGTTEVNNTILTAELWFLTSTGKQNILLTNSGREKTPGKIDFSDDYDIPLTGNIGIVKVDKKNQQKILPNVGFVVQSQATNKYLKRSGNTIQFTENRGEATIFRTREEDGKIEITNIPIGTYIFYEVDNPNEGYEVEGTPIATTTNTGTTTFTKVTNEKKYINISGYVWEDIQSGKQSIRNNLYRESADDSEDTRVQNVIVRLKDKNGNVLEQTTTNGNGEYIFRRVLIQQLANYYIEFEYDGLIYENVDKNIQKTNGSKAVEGDQRTTFNNKFARVESYSKDTVSVKDENGTEQYKIQYKLNPEEHKAEISNTGNTKIIADTNRAQYVLSSPDQEDITDVNLGIFKRQQADLAIMQDVDQVKIGVKGYEHIYKYGSRFDSNNEAIEEAWNVGVKFRSKYGSESYLRPVYKADAEYYDETNANNNLKMLLTYRIGLRNHELPSAKVNTIVDYYDKRYTVVAAGTGMDAKGNITGKLATTNATSPVQEYSAISIDTSSIIIEQNINQYIYIQFELSRENVLELLNEAEQTNNEVTPNLKNVVEITSYTSYSNKNATQLYAAVDKNSVAGNSTPNDKTTYEDDTDASPNVGLTIANARTISGLVFEDNTDSKLLEEQNIRQGDGKYDAEKENEIGGIKVQMVEIDKNGNETIKAETQTADDGTYRFSEFTPGNYIIRYTWGDGMYKIVDQNKIQYENTVENYKSTIFEEERYNKETTDKRYYQKYTDIAQTQALDDWELRQQIDKEANSHNGTETGYNHSTQVTTRQMIANAPQMEFGVEYNDTDLDNVTLINGEVKFEVKNMDFGLIERAKQGIILRKRVAHITIKLADGQIIADADVDENGKLSGQTNYLTYMPPSANNGIYNNGFLKAEIDKELIQTAYVEIKYEFEIINTSEADFASEGYYKFGNEYYTSKGKTGEINKEKDIITMSPTKIVDYLDSQTILKVEDETNIKYGWKETTMQELQTAKLVATNVTEGADWNTKANVYVTEYLKDAKMKPVRVISEEKKAADIEKIYLVAEKTLAPNEKANYINQAEIIEIDKPSGSKLTSTPGNYKPFETAHETDDSTAEEVIIMPSTGENRNYVVITIITIAALAILGTGVYFIKRKI